MHEQENRDSSFLQRLRTRKNVAFSRNYAETVAPEAYEQLVMQGGRQILAKRIHDMFVAHLASQAPPTPILDIAAGTGIISRELAKSYQVTAMDLSEPGLTYLNQRNSEVQTVPGDMNDSLPFPDGSFDGVTTVWGNRFITDTDHFLHEVSRVLRPGGVFIWPIFPREGISWKLQSGLRQHTQTSLSKRRFAKWFSNRDHRLQTFL